MQISAAAGRTMLDLREFLGGSTVGKSPWLFFPCRYTMGRAYPEAQMTSVAVGDLRPWPCVLYDPRGIEAVVTKVPNWRWMERVSRKICVELGSIAATCKAPRTGREVKDWGIHFTVTKAIGIGRRVRQAQRHR